MKEIREELGVKLWECEDYLSSEKIYILNGRITKTICEARNLNKLLQAREMTLNLGLVENLDSGMINDACLTELTSEWGDENGESRCTVGNVGKLLSEVFDRTPEAKRSKFSSFASYTGLSLCRMMLRISSERSFSFIRIRNFGLFVTLLEGDSLRIYFASLLFYRVQTMHYLAESLVHYLHFFN